MWNIFPEPVSVSLAKGGRDDDIIGGLSFDDIMEILFALSQSINIIEVGFDWFMTVLYYMSAQEKEGKMYPIAGI